MSISKRMIDGRIRDRPHPLAEWHTPAPADELAASSAGRWVNVIGIDLATLADPGWQIRPSRCPGFVEIGFNRYTQGRWIGPSEPTPAPKPPRPAAPVQLSWF